jgi:hypothetical protein
MHGGEACEAESGDEGSRHRVATTAEEEAGIEAAAEETIIDGDGGDRHRAAA